MSDMSVKKTKNKIKRARKRKKAFFSYGNMDPDRGRILVLTVAIIMVISALVVQNVLSIRSENVFSVVVAHPVKAPAIQKEIRDMVQGYPIEKMTPYIAKKDPKVAAFLVAIAKKESAWGKRAPVLNGQDCYNYWGFRLASERMGTGGHTCFDSPEEAVAVVGARIDEMVNEENIETSKDMIVWKCGYGCQDEPKSPSEQKWIKDVDMYYKTLTN
jgi:hypothetical protein